MVLLYNSTTSRVMAPCCCTMMSWLLASCISTKRFREISNDVFQRTALKVMVYDRSLTSLSWEGDPRAPSCAT
jgi:hypothetical protein